MLGVGFREEACKCREPVKTARKWNQEMAMTANMPVNVPLSWKTISWLLTDTWKKNIAPKLKSEGLATADLKRCVYVIRLNGEYCIRYTQGRSPTIYIGEGNFNQRINAHRKWISELTSLVREFSFEVRILVPRVKNNNQAYRDAEAAILIHFKKQFRCAPLWNSQMENRIFLHYQYNKIQINRLIGIGQGVRYKWAVEPMRACLFYDSYLDTQN